MGLLSWIKKKPGELFPGVEKPTTVVAKLFAAHILENCDIRETVKEPKFGSMSMYASDRYTVEYPLGTIYLSCYYGAYSQPWSVYGVNLKDSDVRFDETERKIILEAFLSAKKIREERSEMKAEAENQQRAIDFIANSLGVGKARPLE